MSNFIIFLAAVIFSCGWVVFMWWLWRSPNPMGKVAPDISRNVLPVYLKQTPEEILNAQDISLQYTPRMEGIGEDATPNKSGAENQTPIES